MKKTAPIPSGLTNGCIGPVFGMFLIAGLSIAGMAVYSAVQCVRVRLTWKSTPATIVQSSFQRSVGSNNSKSYDITVRYRYDYQGETYEGSSVGPPGSPIKGGFPIEGMAEAWVSDHPVGTATTAFVDPTDPHEAALETSLGFTNSVAFFFGIPFVAIGYAAISDFFPWSKRPIRKGIIGYVALAWEAFALLLHLAAGSVSFVASILFAGYFYVASRMMWETFHPKPRRRRGENAG